MKINKIVLMLRMCIILSSSFVIYFPVYVIREVFLLYSRYQKKKKEKKKINLKVSTVPFFIDFRFVVGITLKVINYLSVSFYI